MPGTKRKKVCFLATLELSVNVFLAQHMRCLQESFDLTVIVNTDDVRFLEPKGIDARVIPVKIERQISPAKDLAALLRLVRLFRREKFDILHSIMPKSGLLAMLAGFIARTPIRIHTFTGQLWKNDRGLKRFIFKTVDRVIAGCSTDILVDSPSQRAFIIEEHIVRKEKSSVIAEGSICGVDMKKFSFDAKTREKLRNELSIGNDHIVFFFLGRLKKDKGVLDLAKAFLMLSRKHENVKLLIIGPDEENLTDEIKRICAEYEDRITVLGFTQEPEKYLSAADVFCLPSYREGFGQVVAEAAAVGVPSIGSKIYGITDTIHDGVTGFLFEVANPRDLAQKMELFAENTALIYEMGAKAREMVAARYTEERVTRAMENYYKKLERAV